MHEIRSIVASPEGRQLIAPKAKKKPAAAHGSLAGLAIHREEVRRSDQRREDRHPRPHDDAVLNFRRRKYDVQLLNISSHGAMVACDIMPRIGESVSLEVEGTNRIACLVRWVRDGRIGVEFREETVVLAPRSVQSHIFGAVEGASATQLEVRKNRPQRHGFIWRGTLHSQEGSFPARLRNISSEGAMIESDRDFDQGSSVVLDLGPAGTAAGEVRWSRSQQIGIRFDEGFDMRDLAAARPSGEASPQMVKPKYLESDGRADSPWASAWEKFTPDDLDRDS